MRGSKPKKPCQSQFMTQCKGVTNKKTDQHGQFLRFSPGLPLLIHTSGRLENRYVPQVLHFVSLAIFTAVDPFCLCMHVVVLSSHRDNLVGDVILVKLLHVLQQLVGVGQEGLLCSSEPIVDLGEQAIKHGTIDDLVSSSHGMYLNVQHEVFNSMTEKSPQCLCQA